MCGINCSSGNAVVAVRKDGSVAGVLSWSGLMSARCKARALTEDDILARALYLAKHGHREEGEELLEQYCEGMNVSQ